MNNFEYRLFKRLSAYVGKTQTELKRMFSIDSSAKNINDVLVTRMLDYEDRSTYIADFKAAGIVPKTIRVQRNGHIKESMSFPTFKFTDIVRETWEESTIYRALANTRFMFVVFEENSSDEYVFARVKFWTISDNDLNEVKKVWARTARIVAAGVKLTYNGKTTNNNLPKQTESPVAHVRPHARDGNDTYPLPDGRQLVKQCFWLNRTYIERIIKEIPEDFYDDQEPMTPGEISFMEKSLTRDFYFLEDINMLFETEYGKQNISHVNAQTLRLLGYVCYPDYIIRNTYRSAEKYFSSLLLSEPTFNLAEWDPRMIQATAVTKVLDVLKANYDVLEFEDGKYITYSQIHNVEPSIDKTSIKRFVDSAIRFAFAEGFFNTASLRKQGFNSELFNLGFSDWFYDSLIKNSGQAKYLYIGHSVVFYLGYAPMTIGNFIKYTLRDVKSMDIELYIREIKWTYGVRFTVEKVISASKNSDCYYDDTMEKVYLNKEVFYDEL